MTTTEPLTSRALRDLDELRSALLAEGAARADDAVVDLGLARVDPARSGPATGAFVVDTGGRRLADEPVRPLHLSAAAEGAPRFAVIDVIAWEGNQLLIEAELTVDEVAALAESGSRPLHLFAATRPASTARALHDRLGDGSDLGLAATLLERSSPAGPDPASAALADRGAPGAGAAIATDADADADAAANAHDAAVADPGATAGPDADAARGVRAIAGHSPAVPIQLGVIVGPPSRRQQTLVRAIEQLADADRSVLVVSSDPAALDRLVVAADRALGGRPAGNLVRVGVPSTRRVGGEPRLTASGIAVGQVPDLLQRLHELSSELRSLLSDSPGDGAGNPGAGGQRDGADGDDVAAVSPDASGISPDAAGISPDESSVSQAPPAPAELEAARRALREADAAVAEALAAASTASARHARARQLVRELDEARTLHRRVDELTRRVEEAAADVAASASGVGRLASGADRRRQLLVAAEVATARLDRRDCALIELGEARSRADALAASRADVARADRAVSQARAGHAAAERAALRARADHARAARRVGELTRGLSGPDAGGVPARAGRAMIAGRVGSATTVSSTRAGAPPATIAAWTERFRARQSVDPEAAAQVNALRQEYRELRREVTRRSADAPRSARIVATTVDQLVSDPAVYERRYDNVLVERAGLVPAATILWAASRAGRALTLAAGPDERPPPPALPDGAVDPARRRWLAESLLELVGLGTVEAVRRHPAGIVVG